MEALDQSLTAQIATIVTELVALLPAEEQETSEEGTPSLDRAPNQCRCALEEISPTKSSLTHTMGVRCRELGQLSQLTL